MMKNSKTICTRPLRFLLVLVLLVIAAGITLVFNERVLQTKNPCKSADGLPGEASGGSAMPDSQAGAAVTAERSYKVPKPAYGAFEQTKATAHNDITVQPTQVPAEAKPTINAEALKAALQQYISKQEGKYGLYYKNLANGQSFGISDRDPYIAASTTKLPMNLLLYRKVAAGEIDLQQKLTYLQEDFEAGTGIIQSSPYGAEYTVRETARLSIVYSDNCGINMIIRLLGIENIRKYMQELGGTIYYERGHRSCPYDLALYAEELYRFYMQEPDVVGVLVEDLQNTQWNDRINKLLPADVKVPHKIGNYPRVYNDVGIVFASEPYVLAVMSDGVAQETAMDVIAQLSRIIYDEVENSME